MGHLKYPLFQDSIENYQNWRNIERNKKTHHVSPYYLDMYAK